MTKESIRHLKQKDHRYYLTVHVKSSLNKSYITKSSKITGNYLGTNQYVQSSFVRQEATKNIVRQATGFFLFLIMNRSFRLVSKENLNFR